MAIVIDANLLVALTTVHPLRAQVYDRFQTWLDQGIALHAPDLARYEVMSALTQIIGAGQSAVSNLPAICTELANLPIVYHAMPIEPRIVEIALSLNRRSAYDAAYLALAEALNAELWTLDSPLYRNAIGQGFNVRLLSEAS